MGNEALGKIKGHAKTRLCEWQFTAEASAAAGTKARKLAQGLICNHVRETWPTPPIGYFLRRNLKGNGALDIFS